MINAAHNCISDARQRRIRRTIVHPHPFRILTLIMMGAIIQLAFAMSGAGGAKASENPEYPGFIDMLLLEKPFSSSRDALKAEIASYVGEGNVSVEGKDAQDGQSFVIHLVGQPYAVVLIDLPVPEDTFKNALKSPYRPKNAEDLVAAHKAHMIISPLKQSRNMGQAVTSAIGLMQLSAIMAELSGANAHFWSTSEMLMAAQPYAETMMRSMRAMDQRVKGQSSERSNLPGRFWVGCRLYAGSERGTVGCLTRGLSSFTGYELDLLPLKWRPIEIVGRIYGTVEYLFRNGPVLRDGQSLGISETEKFRLQLIAAEGTRPNRFVLKLEVASTD